MKSKHRKILVSGTAVAAAGALGAGALLQTELSVQASSDMMPGIETIINENTEEEPFRVLELVDNSEDAEIGYYISGQEPSLKLYEYQYQDADGTTQTVHFSSVQEALSKLPAKYRTGFMMNARVNADGSIDNTQSTGIKQIGSVTGADSSTFPLSSEDYQEKYFLDSGDDASEWNEVELTDFDGQARIDTVQINGSYKENASGTGNYTKGEQQYYPIRSGSQEDAVQPEKYRENIQSFYSTEGSDSRGAYFLKFTEVPNSKVNSALAQTDGGQSVILPEYDHTEGRYGYYENVYTDLSKEIADNIGSGNYQFPGENPDESVIAGKQPIQKNEKDAVQNTITDSNEFSSGDAGSNAADSEAVTGSDQGSFDGESSDDSGSIDFENGYQEDDTGSGDIAGADEQSFDSEVSLEQQSYEQPVDSSDAGAFSDDFSAQAAEFPDTNVEIQEQESSTFEEDATEADYIEESGAATDASTDLTAERKPIGGIVNETAKGTQADPYIYLGKNIAQYPYFKYELVGDLEYVEKKAGEIASQIAQNPEKPREKGDILLENDQYWYYEPDESGTLKKYALSVVTGRQPVSYNELQQIPDDFNYNYYYRVEEVYFCCNTVDNSATDPGACAYQGWYSPVYPENEDAYIPVNDRDGKVATHYISEAAYSLTPGNGNYDFVPDASASSYQVQVDSLYYKGGYINNDWFKKDVFHLEPKASVDDEDGEFEKFKIEVDTKSALDALTPVYAQPVTGEAPAVQAAGIEEGADLVSAQAEQDAAGIFESAQTPDAGDVDFSSEYQATETQEAADVSLEEDASTETEDNAEAEVSDEEDVSEPDVQADEESIDEAGAAGNTLTDSLKEYDLIYINGDLNKDVAEAAAESGVPCIINAARVNDGSEIANAFSSVIRDTDEDADGNYVNSNIYFFKDILADENADSSSLLNLDFHINFNDALDSEEDTTYGAEEKMHGFEEIIKYINSENRYRSLGNADSSSTDISDGESGSEGSETQSIDPLTREISQARAIEYIINYQYKRVLLMKEEMNVLDITPAKSGAQITKEELMKWCDTNRIQNIEACCENTGTRVSETTGVEMAWDGDPSTRWNMRWEESDGKKKHQVNDNDKHRLTVTFREPQDITGFTYRAREFGSAVWTRYGVLEDYRIECKDQDGNVIYTTPGGSANVGTALQSGEQRTFEFGETVKNVSTMTLYFEKTTGQTPYGEASCAELGVVYADNSQDMSMKMNVDTMTAAEFVGHIDDIASKYDMIYIGDTLNESARDKFVNGNSPMLYTHVGGLRAVTDNLTTDSTQVMRDNTNFYTRLLGQMDSEYVLNADGTRYQDENGKYHFAPVSTYNEDGGGYFRGSGNDMTDQQRQELMEFVKSGYPVILGDKLVNGSGDNRTVNKDLVDASSYYYQFLKEALNYSNVLTKGELNTRLKDLKFFMNLAKPQIVFDELPPEPQRVDESKQTGQGEIETGEMKYVFHLENDSDAVPASSTYDCKLYIDLNFDGNLSDKEVQDKYITISDSKGNVLVEENGRYHLRLGETYTLRRKLPAEYFKLITWKLVVSSNNNEYIHTSRQGYTKQKRMEGQARQVIKVLQIMPDRAKQGWTLENNQQFQNYLNKVEDFDIKVKSVCIKDFDKDKLNDYQILIIGFDDAYQDIPNDNGQVDAIKAYIQSGRSVIFSHDTTSYMHYTLTDRQETSNIYPYISETEDANSKQYLVFRDDWMNRTAQNPSWGVSLNTIIRSVVGMDRYGITSDKPAAEDGTTISQILKRGHALTSNEVNYAALLKYAGDVAYKQGDESRSSSYAQTQGLTNGILKGVILGASNNLTTKATKVNDGAITQYPYRMGDTLNVSSTHGQWYQLAMEEDLDLAGRSDGKTDVVVWYCLGDSLYGDSPNDARNFYYYYSKGNVIYTGTGHSRINNNADETKLFINSIVAAANVTAVKPEVRFVKTFSPTAETEETRYYMTDQSSWTSGEGNVLEKDMTYYINVRDYNMVSADLGQEDLDKQEMTVQFYIDDDVNGSENHEAGCPATGKISDITEKVGTLSGYGKVGTINIGGDKKFHLTQNSAYGLKLSDIEPYLRSQSGNFGYKENCKLYVKVTSTVYLYGQETTSSVWSEIDLKQRQLFELD